MLERMEAAETSAPEDERVDEADEQRGGFGSLGSIIFLLVLTWAAGVASFPLNDNSFFTHLATGRIILDRGSVPTADPYTFTAQGEAWTVQSWLASVAYAGVERLASDLGLRLLVLLVVLVAAAAIWRLTRQASSLIVRLLLMTATLLVANDLWRERPYMVGVIGLAVVWMAFEGEVRPALLVPLMWLWGNTHGSFPLAIVLAMLLVGGAALDRRAAGQPIGLSSTERRSALALAVGTVAAAVGPIGPRLLLFPFKAVSRGEVFDDIIEWQPPVYRSVSERGFLILVLVTMLLLARHRSWRLALAATVFAGAALYAQRNVVMATVVLVAVCARAAPSMGSLRSSDRPRIGRPVAAITGVLLLLVCAATAATPVDGFGGYPVRALAWMGEGPTGAAVATEMQTGNLLEVLDGATGEVFIDDRVDMFPAAFFDDYLTLGRAQPGWDQVLGRYDIEMVVWSRTEPLSAVLVSSPAWSVVFTDTQWIVACRRSSCG